MKHTLTLFLCTAVSVFLFSCTGLFQEKEPEVSDPAAAFYNSAPTPRTEPLQFFFPHGQHGPLQIMGDSIVRAASWTRGDGVAFFNRDTLEYEGGVLSAGYVSDSAVYENSIYLATGYSILIVRRLPGKDPEILENMLMNFPSGGVDQLAVDRSLLYVTAPGGLRVYRIQPDGRLLYQKTYEDLTDLRTFAVANGKIHYVLKKTPNIRYCLSPDGKRDSEIYPKPLAKLLPAENKDGEMYCLFGSVLMDEERNPFSSVVLRIRNRKQENRGTGYDVFTANSVYHIDGNGTMKKLRDNPAASARSTVLAADRALYWTEGHYLKSSEGVKMPLVLNEGPVCCVKPFVYSVQRSGNTYLLYGRNAADRKKQSYDVLLEWDAVAKKQFYYDIVMPPYSFLLHSSGKYLFAPEAVLDITNPANPSVAAKIDGAAACVTEDENGRIWLAQGDKLTVIDGKALPEIKILTEYKTGHWTEIVIDGNLLYSNTRDKLRIFDVTDIANPKELSWMSLRGNFYKMAYREKHLYIAPYSGNAPLRIVNVSNPAKPRIVENIERFTGSSILGIQFYRDRLYVADRRQIVRFILHEPHRLVGDVHWEGADRAMQGYNYIDVRDGVLVGKKYPRFDVWRIDE